MTHGNGYWWSQTERHMPGKVVAKAVGELREELSSLDVNLFISTMEIIVFIVRLLWGLVSKELLTLLSTVITSRVPMAMEKIKVKDTQRAQLNWNLSSPDGSDKAHQWSGLRLWFRQLGLNLYSITHVNLASVLISLAVLSVSERGV